MHVPVLQNEVLKYLDPKENENFVDATIGSGGHSAAILKANGPHGKILGIDRDPEILKRIEPKERLILVCDNFVHLKSIIKQYNFKPVNGILFDLGMSSWHLDESGRGFSFRKDEPLDMRYYSANNEQRTPKENKFPAGQAANNNLTAERIVNEWPEEEIGKILLEYGGERFAKRIAKRVCEVRRVKPIKTTFQLVEAIRKAFPKKYKFGKIHFATRIFQALRIAVNNELENLETALPQALEILESKGRLAVISFHSGEDKIVKNFFKEQSKQSRIEISTQKPIRPSQEEIRTNPRARSAKLRAAIKT